VLLAVGTAGFDCESVDLLIHFHLVLSCTLLPFLLLAPASCTLHRRPLLPTHFLTALLDPPHLDLLPSPARGGYLDSFAYWMCNCTHLTPLVLQRCGMQHASMAVPQSAGG
jgi:hypothetical protein